MWALSRKAARATLVAVGLALGLPSPGHAADWTVTLQTGQVWAAPETVTYHHADGRKTRFTLQPEAQEWSRPIYWSMRIGRFSGDAGWELELMHDKLIERDTPAAIDQFEITHGYNHIWLNRAWRGETFTYRLGLGPVLAHPTIDADGRSDSPTRPSFLKDTYMEGSQIGGITAQAGIQTAFRLGWGVAFSLEAKASYSEVEVEAAGGRVRVPRRAIHLLGGFIFGREDRDSRD